MSTYEFIELEVHDGIARVTLDRPDRLNAMHREMVDELDDALDAADADPDVRVIVLRGSGRAFCTGFDLAQSGKRTDDSFAADFQHMGATSAKARRLWTSPKVTIAQVHGWCLAGGLMFAMNCDLVYAAESSKIGLPEARSMGISPEFGMWPLTINIRRTKELMLTGDLVSGAEAAEMGMINRSVPDDQLDDYVGWMAGRLASLDPETIILQKAALNAVADVQGLASLWNIGFHSDALQHKQAARHVFVDRARADGIKAALTERDAPFGGAGVSQTEAWNLHRQAGSTAEVHDEARS